MRHTTVFRIEQQGEEGIPFPDLISARAEPPSHAESTIATSTHGVVLAESIAVSSGPRKRARFTWRLTVAGEDVLTGCVRGGMRRAS